MESLKAQVLATAIAMNDSGINRGSAGNVSARSASGFIITPTGMAYADCDVADMVSLDAVGVPSVGADNTALQRRQPSSEWRFHRDIYALHPDAGAIVHTHAPFATWSRDSVETMFAVQPTPRSVPRNYRMPSSWHYVIVVRV